MPPPELCAAEPPEPSLNHGEQNRMQNVLFKTDDPENAKGIVDFYLVSLTLEGPEGQSGAVPEVHGWFDPSTRAVTLDREWAPQAETFTSFGDAVDRFCQMRIHRAVAGFVHSFSWLNFVGRPKNHRRVAPFRPNRKPQVIAA